MSILKLSRLKVPAVKLPDHWLLGSAALLILSIASITSAFVQLSGNEEVVINQKRQLVAGYKSVTEQTKLQDFLDSNSAAFENLIGTSRAQRRLRWAEILESAGADIGLPGLSYELRAFQQLSDSNSYPFLSVGYETLDITLELSHDNELLSFIDYLQEKSTQVFDITSLSISRSPAQVQSVAASPLLQVRCTIRWYSIEVSGESNAKV